MFGPYWLYQLPLWVVIFLLMILLLVPMEVGFRLGMRLKPMQRDLESEARGDVTIAAMMALLGLMLAFTYSFSLSRADLRKAALIKEVNAISTAFLRADLLPEPGRSEVRKLLFDYAKSRYVEARRSPSRSLLIWSQGRRHRRCSIPGKTGSFETTRRSSQSFCCWLARCSFTGDSNSSRWHEGNPENR